MDDIKKFALEDDYDEMISKAAHSIDDSIHESEYEDFSSSIIDEDDKETFMKSTDSSVFHSSPNLFSSGSTTYDDKGNRYSTDSSLFGTHDVTRGSDGSLFRTYDNIFSEGKTTYGSNGITYKTVDKIFSEGMITYGSDGSKKGRGA